MNVEDLIDELMKCDPKSKVFCDMYCNDPRLMVVEVCPDKRGSMVVLVVRANCVNEPSSL